MKDLKDTTNLTWSFSQIWNKSLEQREERELRPRNRIWASELGGAYIDRYLKMNGVPYSNPIDPRSLRKFEAGNLMEWVVGLVLKRAGILTEYQKWIGFQYPGLLEVSGKLDYTAGGYPDWGKAEEEIKELGLPDFFDRATSDILSYFKKTFPKGLNEVVLEIKSCSAFMFDNYAENGANPNHKLQAYHYLKATNRPEAHIVYISKDDLRMAEYGVFAGQLEEEYKNDIEVMTNCFQSNIEPPKEKEIVFENDKFSANWKVGYSNYLTKLYGYKNQTEFDAKNKPLASKFNRVLKRVKEGKTMTEDNLTILEGMKKVGYGN